MQSRDPHARIFLDPARHVVGIAEAARDAERLSSREDPRTDDCAVIDGVADGEVYAGAR